MAVTIGLDFGCGSTEIYVKGKGIVLREPSVAAVDNEGNVIAAGVEALLIRGRAPGSVTLRRPMRDSVISDFNLCAELLDRFLELAAPHHSKQVVIAVKCGIGGENRELIKNALLDCRVSSVEFVDAPLAALRGCELSTQDGVIICDIGAGSIESSYIRDGDILRTETYFGGGSEADQSICDYTHRRYGLVPTQQDACAAKQLLDMNNVERRIALTGRDSSTGMPRRIEIRSSELIHAAAPQIKGASDNITAVLSNLPRYAGKAASAGSLVLVGGGALLSGIAEYISEAVGMEAIVAEAPADAIVRGLGQLIE